MFSSCLVGLSFTRWQKPWVLCKGSRIAWSNPCRPGNASSLVKSDQRFINLHQSPNSWVTDLLGLQLHNKAEYFSSGSSHLPPSVTGQFILDDVSHESAYLYLSIIINLSAGPSFIRAQVSLQVQIHLRDPRPGMQKFTTGCKSQWCL